MSGRLLAGVALALGAALGGAPVAGAAAPGGFSAPRAIGANLGIVGSVTAADAVGGPYAAVAFADRSGGIWAVRVRADGSLGSPLPAADGQAFVRDLRVAITQRGEIVVVWAALAGRYGPFAVRDAVAAPGRSFSGPRTLATVGSNTSATPRIAALRGGTVAVLFRATDPHRGTGVLRYARRAPSGAFGPARSLGHDGVGPQLQAARGAARCSSTWARGSPGHRALKVAAAQRGAALPGRATSVAGRIPGNGTRGLGGRHGVGDVDAARRRRDHRLRPAHTRAGNRPARRSGAGARGGRLRPAARRARLSERVLAAWNPPVPGVPGRSGTRARLGPGDRHVAGRAAGVRRRRLQPELAGTSAPRRDAPGPLHAPAHRRLSSGRRRRPRQRRLHGARRRGRHRHARRGVHG